MAKERVSTYDGEQVGIRYDRGLCIHAAECGRAKSELFNTQNDPWCTPDAAAADDAAEVVSRCPTGALVLTRGPVETAPGENTVHVSPGGPLYLRGELAIEGQEGGSPFRAALCRCGQSANKPFCDNAHKKAGFRDAGPVGERGPGFEGEDGGPLQVKLAENGPLLLRGRLTITSGSGRVAWRGDKCALCRCGGSKNKPFCDGSHKGNGFVG